jgi:hypothetical protein
MQIKDIFYLWSNVEKIDVFTFTAHKFTRNLKVRSTKSNFFKNKDRNSKISHVREAAEK